MTENDRSERMSQQLWGHHYQEMMGDCFAFHGKSILEDPLLICGTNLWRWHLKCWFWSTYANCCNFPDEAPFWYLDVAKIVLHFLCGPLCHLHRSVSVQSAPESGQNCKQIASDCQHCEKLNCLQIYLNHWPIFISYGTWYSWLLNWRPFLLCSALWCDGKRSLPNQLPFFYTPLLH